MSSNKRKSSRRPLSMKAFLYTPDGWPLCECKLRDVSETGAQLTILPSETCRIIFCCRFLATERCEGIAI